MRPTLLALLLVGSTAFADVGPRPPKCTVPVECLTCVATGQADAGYEACLANAADAGLSKSECNDRSGSWLTTYYCPPGKEASRGCGCSSAEGLFAFAALVLLGRRKFWKR